MYCDPSTGFSALLGSLTRECLPGSLELPTGDGRKAWGLLEEPDATVPAVRACRASEKYTRVLCSAPALEQEGWVAGADLVHSEQALHGRARQDTG